MHWATATSGFDEVFDTDGRPRSHYSSLISILVAAWRFARSGSGPQSMLEPLYELGNEIRKARSDAELDEIEKRIDGILKAELARNAGGEGADSAEMAALGLAAHRLQYLMSHCRARLAHTSARPAIG